MTSALPVLPVIVPALAALVLAALGSHMPRRVGELAAIGAAVFALACDVALLSRSADAPIVYWFGGWLPRGDVAMGVAFVVDPFGAGFASLAALLTVAALAFALPYFDSYHAQLHALVLGFMAALEGFGLSGDLFNLFVFFELMGAAAFALCAYKTKEEAPMQGAINFAVLNTVGAVLVLFGIAIVYARTGALDFAAISRGLTARADAAVVCAFAFIAAGFFVKAAVIPFHFWLADAHAVAPTPICVLFSGVMVEAGLYAVVRVFGASFATAFEGHVPRLGVVLAAIGAATAVIGAVMSFVQRHLKRLLAYSTVSHAGTMLVGLSRLDSTGVGGAAHYALAHGCIKGALFLCAGIVLHRFRTVDEIALRGYGRRLPRIGALFCIGAWALAGGAPFGMWAAARTIAATGPRLPAHLAEGAAIVTGAAVMRVFIRVFIGWGAKEPESRTHGGETTEEPETKEAPRTPFPMWAPVVVLLSLGAAAGLSPALASGCARAAARLLDTKAYASAVLDATAPTTPAIASAPALEGLAHGVLVGLAAVLLAVATLGRERVPRVLARPCAFVFRTVTSPLRAAHTGRVGDDLAWLALGAALLGVALRWATG